MSELKCLDNIIGLSQTDCACYDDQKPSDFDTSNSGLYLDQLEGLELSIINADADCGDGNIWEKMESAIRNAKINLRTDLLASIGTGARNKRKPFSGIIGQKQYRTFLNDTLVYAGLRITDCDIKGGEFTIKNIHTLLDGSATFDIEIWNNIDDVPLKTFQVNSVANTWTENDVLSEELTFPLYTEDADKLEYYILYKPNGLKGAENKLDCGCSRKPDYMKWFNIQGIKVNDPTIDGSFFSDGYAHGLRIDVQINCNNAHVICGGDDQELDFDNDPIARVLAYAIRYKAGEILIEDILASGQINRYTMLDKERLWGKRNHYRSEFSQRIMYLTQEIDLSVNDCFACGDDSIRQGSILS
ncbi:MAG: hypothetical protein KC589_09250 [Nanoarchaeota archaeon]|nr:hypothetical protein [Nanoarchaeota archaeon]